MLNSATTSFLVFRRFAARYRKPPTVGMEVPPVPAWAKTVIEANKPTYEWQKTGTGEAPHALYAVTRLKTTFGRPWWEKKIIKDFGLDGGREFVVVKNTPAMCEKLAVVQHLLKIMPVKFPNGLPKNPEDFKHCFLKHNGEFVVRSKIDVTPDQLVPFNAEQEEKQLDRKYLRSYHKKRYLDHRYLEEHHPEKHDWRRNQDGQEHRYKDLHAHWRQQNNVTDPTFNPLEPRGSTKGTVRDIKNWFSQRNNDPVFQKVVQKVEKSLPPPRF